MLYTVAPRCIVEDLAARGERVFKAYQGVVFEHRDDAERVLALGSGRVRVDVSGIERACVEARVYEVNATLADTTTPVSPEHAERRLKARAEIVVDVPKQEAPPDA